MAAPVAAQLGTSEERFATAVVIGFPSRRAAPDRIDVVNSGHGGPNVLGRHGCASSSVGRVPSHPAR
ncbi:MULTISPECIES: hypothetical protein [Streptomyces]|uniref:hypothetical protein n=1 Tax=Streptomyces TaxID=1883 RepID=UPI0023DD32BB|nr:hypothetical protein [Streptomyces sp. FXJ1.172]WEP00576.1 hypothetical protein A6P39_043365 [Streptomyces sp. FXJ1.172]